MDLIIPKTEMLKALGAITIITGDQEIQGHVIYNGDITYKGTVTYNGTVTLEKDMNVAGNLTLNANNSGAVCNVSGIIP